MPFQRKPNESILLEVPREELRCVHRSAKRCISRNQANGSGEASSSVSFASLSCVGSCIIKLVLETDPQLVCLLTSMGCIESGGEGERATAGNLENSDERTWSWFRMFWLRMLQGVKDRTVEASALSEADEWACCSARIAKKLRVLTILENNRYRESGCDECMRRDEIGRIEDFGSETAW